MNKTWQTPGLDFVFILAHSTAEDSSELLERVMKEGKEHGDIVVVRSNETNPHHSGAKVFAQFLWASSLGPETYKFVAKVHREVFVAQFHSCGKSLSILPILPLTCNWCVDGASHACRRMTTRSSTPTC